MAELHGEALDRAVAAVLGWTHAVPGPDWQMPEVLHWSDPDGNFVGRLPHFSSDWSRLPEMLNWLGNNCGTFAAWWESDGSVFMGCHRTEVVMPFSEDDAEIGVTGETLPIAVARLIAAVAEAKDG